MLLVDIIIIIIIIISITHYLIRHGCLILNDADPVNITVNDADPVNDNVESIAWFRMLLCVESLSKLE